MWPAVFEQSAAGIETGKPRSECANAALIGDNMQTRWQSFIESWANVLVGYGVALLTQIIVFPLFGLQVSIGQNIQIGIIFTLVSLARSYVLRRVFNRWHR